MRPSTLHTAADFTAEDLATFSAMGVTEDLLRRAHVERVSDRDARERFGIRGSGDMTGVVFPYEHPISGCRVTARVRRDSPEIEDGKPRKKYVLAFGDRRHFYFVPGCKELLEDVTVPMILIEAEKSALALMAWSQRADEKILPVAIGGCWGWRGRIGKTIAASGDRNDESGAIDDLLCAKDGRRAVILLDANASSNAMVQQAREALASQLRKQKADVRILNLPTGEGINGPDDFIAVRGDKAMRDVLAGVESGIGVLNDIESFVRRFIVMGDAEYIATALWIAHTHCYRAREWTPYLMVTSAQKRCAKFKQRQPAKQQLA